MTILFLILLAPLVMVNATFIVEALAGLARTAAPSTPKRPVAVAIIVPAHDEEAIIERTLASLVRAAGPDAEILVVADNCLDQTAATARESGATVIERDDPTARGKGHALAFARDWLRQRPPAVVIILDADCHTDAASLSALAGRCARSGLPCQAINLLEPQSASPPMVQISTFAFLLKNLVRQRGLQRLAGGVHLTGTGMALPWAHFDRADLATSSIVEDIRLGLELAQRGARPQLVENAVVWSAPSDARGTLTQRRRWEGGYLAMARQFAFRTLMVGVRRADMRIVASGLDLFVPPLALLAAVNALALIAGVAGAALGIVGWLPSIVLGASGSLIAAAIVAAWAREGRAYVTGAMLIRLPLYVLWKIPMYLGLAKAGAPKDWLRTGRTPGTDHEA